MDRFAPQTVSDTDDVRIPPAPGEVVRKDHDFLSFLSLFTTTIHDISTDLELTNIVLGPAINLKDPAGRGKFFSITLVEENEISSNLMVSLDRLKPLPKVVAVKVPNLGGDANSLNNRKIFSSMAKELQVLRNPDVLYHPNIVTLLGVCWQRTSQKQLLPVFIMEASEIGNLKAFLHSRKLTPEEETTCCIDIASGISAIHKKGIIHGDIKPENVLVFTNNKETFTSKICDFGSSIFISAADTDTQPLGGTKLWQAPEAQEATGVEALLQTDIYSLGLVLWYIFSTEIADAILDGDLALLDTNKASGELVNTILETLESLHSDGEPPSRLETIQYQQCILGSALASPAVERWDADAILACLYDLNEAIELDDPKGEKSLHLSNAVTSTTCDDLTTVGEPTAKGKEPAYLFEGSAIKQAHTALGEHNRDTIRTTDFIKDIWLEDETEGIMNMTRTSHTLDILPTTVYDELLAQLEVVANNPEEDIVRRSRAAYQFAMGALRRIRLSYTTFTDAEKPLAMLEQAASLGDQAAQVVVNTLHEAFGRAPPFTREVEIPWLMVGTVNGSMTARQRLRLLDQESYSTAIQVLRDEYCGHGVKHHFDEGSLEDHLIMHDAGISRPYPRMLQILAYLGMSIESRKVLSYDFYDVNERDAWGETALLVACRTGHAEIARLLLESGADASIASNEGLTPLHFLAAFDDDDTQSIGTLLVRANAIIEARSTSGQLFNSRIDCQFGVAEGTPLLWAIGARSLVATKVLLDFGADPFDDAGKDLTVSNSWFNNVHYSPVDFAAHMHQHELLKVMLAHYCWRKSLNDCALSLNRGFRLVAPHPDFAALPLFWAINYSSPGILERSLLHGKNQKFACKKTIQTLVAYGASSSEVDSEKRSALHVSSRQGHPFLTAHILQNNAVPSDYTADNFLKILFNATIVNDYPTFNLLVEHADKKSVELDDFFVQDYYARTAESTNNTSFIDYYLQRHGWTYSSNRDDTEAFEKAITKGHFDTARRIFEKGKVYLKKKRMYPEAEGESSSTIFGRLINRAKFFRNAVDKVESFLAITGGSDDIFHKVFVIHDMELTALQCACLHADYRRDLAASGPLIDIILQYYREKVHLNAQIPEGNSAGRTALHLAVDGGNIPATDRLLQAGADPNIINDNGETALDRAKARWRNQDRFLGGVPEAERPSLKERHGRVTVQLTNLLIQAGAVCRRYWGMIRKLDDDTMFCETFEGELEFLMDIHSDNMLEFETLMPGIKETVIGMKPDHMFLISLVDPLNLESEIQSRKLAQATGSEAPIVPARWGTGGCQIVSASSNSDVASGMTPGESSTRREAKPTLPVEVVSSPLSHNRTVKIALDHELTDLCDWFRDHA